MLERSQEIFLELEVRQLVDLEESHGKLPQRIEGKKYNANIGMASDLSMRQWFSERQKT